MSLPARPGLPPPYAFAGWDRVVAEARGRGLDVIRLDIGNPDLPPPPRVIERLVRSVRRPDRHGYAGYRGRTELREAVAAYYERRFGVVLDPDREVAILLGSKDGIVHLTRAIAGAGDTVLIPDPGYPVYAGSARLAGARTHRFSLLPEKAYAPDLPSISEDVVEAARLLWLNYPNNPTGAGASLELCEEAVGFAGRHGLLLGHDAPYCEVTYGDHPAPSVLQVDGAVGTAVEFNSFSKTWSMAGWRIGMAVGNADALAALARVKSNVDSGLFLPLQDAAIEALSTDRDWIEAQNAVYARRMTILVDGLCSAGLAAQRPSGGLYVWLPVPMEEPSEGFARRLLERSGVAVSPGSYFGPAGEGFVRLSITVPEERLTEAVARIGAFTRTA